MCSLMLIPSSVSAATPPDSCFNFGGGTISEYYNNENNNIMNPACPKNVDIPSTIGGVPVTNIGVSAFASKQITALTIPNSVTTIDNYAFYNNLITSLTIPSSVSTIGFGAFKSNLLNTVNVVSSVAVADGSIFSHNPLTSITYNGTTYTDSEPMTEDCFNFDSGTGTIVEHLFADLTIIDSVGEACINKTLTIPTTIGGTPVTTLGDWSFQNSYLTSIILPNNLTTIGQGSLMGNHLSSVTIPSTVTSISSNAFNSQTQPGGTTLTEYTNSNYNPVIGQEYLDDVVYLGIFIDPGQAISLGLTDSQLTESTVPGDYNNDGDQNDIISGYLINPAYILVNYLNENNDQVSPSQIYTGDGLSTYLASENTTNNLTLYFKAGENPNLLLTPPTINGYTTPSPDIYDSVLVAGENIFQFIYLASSNTPPANNGGGSSSNNSNNSGGGSTSQSNVNQSGQGNSNALTKAGTPTLILVVIGLFGILVSSVVIILNSRNKYYTL